MFWINLVFVLLCSKFAITAARNREDWWAAVNITTVLLNIGAIIVNRV